MWENIWELLLTPPHTIPIVCGAIVTVILIVCFYKLWEKKKKSKENRLKDISQDPIEMNTLNEPQANEYKQPWNPLKRYKQLLLPKLNQALIPLCGPKKGPQQLQHEDSSDIV